MSPRPASGGRHAARAVPTGALLMRLVSFVRHARASWGVAIEEGVVDLGARLGSRFAGWRAVFEAGALDEVRRAAEATAPDFALAEIAYLPPVPHPEKILCVGVNYADRNAEYRDGS